MPRKKPINKLNDLSAKEWIQETISVWRQKGLGAGHPDAKIEKLHPAPFSFTDVSRLIKFFTKKNNTVLDPFVGIGSTLKACAIEKRKGIGIDLNKDFINLSKKRLKDEVIDGVQDQQIFKGDARQVLKKLKTNSVDFVVTSPPYWNILSKVDHKVKKERISKNLIQNYGNNKKDLANIKDYKAFLSELTGIFLECKRLLKPKKYISIIVSDFRHKSKYYLFHSDLMNCLEEIGYEPKGLKVLYQSHKQIFPYGYPYSYVPNIHNQFILIMQKKDEK